MAGEAVGSANWEKRSNRDRNRERALWTLQIIVAIAFFVPGLSKLIFYVDIFDDIGWGDWFQYVTGIVQILGATALLIPRLSGLAALALVGFVLSALGFHATYLDFTPIPIIILGILSAVIAWGRRNTIVRLFGARNSQ